MIILTCLCIVALFFVGYLLIDYCQAKLVQQAVKEEVRQKELSKKREEMAVRELRAELEKACINKLSKQDTPPPLTFEDEAKKVTLTLKNDENGNAEFEVVEEYKQSMEKAYITFLVGGKKES